MRRSPLLAALVAEAALVTSQPIANASSPQPSATAGEPCSIISSSAASYLSAIPKATAVPLKPSEVHTCLQSVPYDEDIGTKQIAWIQDVFQFQSTTAYLKDPPKSYPLSAVDLFGGLNNISASIVSGLYSNEYDIEVDLYNLVASAKDGHLNYTPFLTGAFGYVRNFSLVSVSLDGIELPKIYVLCESNSPNLPGKADRRNVSADIQSLSNASFVPSAVTSIDGQDVTNIEQYGRGMQDPDALYNSALYSPAAATTPFRNGGGAFRSSAFTQHSDGTTCTFENDSSRVFSANAMILPLYAKALPGSGDGIYDYIISLASNISSTSSSSSSTTAPSSLPLGPTFPTPIVKHSQNLLSGYFMNEVDNSDVAVLNIASFNGEDTASIYEFLQKSSTFLANCSSANRKRLIVDVRNNGGGVIALGYALFQQLFPSIVPYSGIRARDSDAFNAIGQIASNNSAQDSAESGLLSSFLNDQTLLQGPDGPNLLSWQQFYGPIHQHGDLFSNVASWAFSDIDYAEQVASVDGNQTTLPPQVFPSESITLLTDGQCSSTCATFSNLMINQGLVKTVTVGGRPNNQPIAVIGGVQGAEVLPLQGPSGLQQFAAEAISLQVNATGNSSAQAKEARRQLLSLASPPPLAPLPGDETVAVNVLDNIAQNDTSATPLQFTGGVPADCRFYYMPADITSMSNTWARVARGVKAGGSGLCINGTMWKSTANGTSINGTFNSPPLVTFQGSASDTKGANLQWIISFVAFVSAAIALF